MSDSLFIKRNRPSTKTITVSKVRPADTNVYASGDVVAESTSAATLWTFANTVRGAGLGGVIQQASVISNVSSALKPELELWLFDTTLTTQNDNAAWAPSDAEMKTFVGRIQFPMTSFITAGLNGAIQSANLGLPFQCTASSTTLFGVLVARNAYIPNSSEEFTIRLQIFQD